MTIKNHIESINSRPANERYVILGLIAVSVIIFIWLLVARPLNSNYTDAQRNLRAAKDEAATVTSTLAEIEMLRRGISSDSLGSNEDIKQLILISAKDAGILDIDVRIDAAGDLELKLDKNRPFVVFKWLSHLRRQYGLTVVQAVISAGNKPDIVSAELLLKATK